MLEYLLLRPQDSALFDGPTGSTGDSSSSTRSTSTTGRREPKSGCCCAASRPVVQSERGRLQCFGTSATLGGGYGDFPRLMAFARRFRRAFEWDPDDAGAAGRRGRAASLARAGPTNARAETLRYSPSLVRTRTRSAELAAPRTGARSRTMARTRRFLGRLLRDDARVSGSSGSGSSTAPKTHESSPRSCSTVRTRTRCSHGSSTCELQRRSTARTPAPLGAVPLPTAGDRGRVRLPTSEHHDDGADAPTAPTRELPGMRTGRSRRAHVRVGTCRRCGTEYLVGLEAEAEGRTTLESAPVLASVGRYLFGGPVMRSTTKTKPPRAPRLATRTNELLCPGCGALGTDAASTVGARPGRPFETRVRPSCSRVRTSWRCPACAGRSNGEIVYRFLSGSEAPVASSPPMYTNSSRRRASRERSIGRDRAASYSYSRIVVRTPRSSRLSRANPYASRPTSLDR